MKQHDIYQHRRHNKNLLMVHLLFVTKYRKPLLTGTFRAFIMQVAADACRKYRWYIRRMETDRDHIHMLIQYNPTDSITSIVRTLKQYSTWQAWQFFEPMLSKHYWKERTLWSDGYFAASIGQVSQATIEHYIENQG